MREEIGGLRREIKEQMEEWREEKEKLKEKIRKLEKRVEEFELKRNEKGEEKEGGRREEGKEIKMKVREIERKMEDEGMRREEKKLFNKRVGGEGRKEKRSIRGNRSKGKSRGVKRMGACGERYKELCWIMVGNKEQKREVFEK